jgi:hypothetical protein
MAQNQRRELVRQQDVAILVYHACAIPVAVKKKAHVGAGRGYDLLAFIRPRICWFWVKATEVFARTGVNLGYVAAKTLKGFSEYACPRAIHRVDHDTW